MILNLFLNKVKRFPLFTLLFFGVAIATQAQITTFPWTETFDDDSTTLADWTQTIESGGMNWTFTDDASTGSYNLVAHDGTKFANYPATSFEGDTTKLVSPALDLSNYTDCTVSFYHVNPLWSPDQNVLNVYYRISETDPWVSIGTFDMDYDDWTSSGDLSIPSDTYQIALEGVAFYGYSLLVDSFMVTGTEIMSVEDIDNAADLFTIYPNPVGDQMHFRSENLVRDLSIYNTVGQEVLNQSLKTNAGSIDVSGLQAGVYMVRVVSDKGVHSYKMIKK